MARDRSSIVKMSRREGYALHPKAHKALVKRTSKPGQGPNARGPRGGKASQYSLQLREKQKVKRLYGLLEKQFSNLMKEASKRQGQSGQILLQFLEQRADNAIYRAGFAPSRRSARQLMTHGHFRLTTPAWTCLLSVSNQATPLSSDRTARRPNTSRNLMKPAPPQAKRPAG